MQRSQTDDLPRGDCSRCLLRARCVYPYIFETWIESGEGARMEVARPFVIEPPFEGGMRKPHLTSYDLAL